MSAGRIAVSGGDVVNMSVAVSAVMTAHHYRKAAAVTFVVAASTLLVFIFAFVGLILLAIAAGPATFGTVGSPS